MEEALVVCELQIEISQVLLELQVHVRLEAAGALLGGEELAQLPGERAGARRTRTRALPVVSTRQEARGKRHEAQGKRHKARGTRQEVRGER